MGALQVDEHHVSSEARGPAPSGVCLVFQPQEGVIGNLAEQQCSLSERIGAAWSQLERRSYDPSASAALKTVGERLSDIADVRESLDDVIASLWLADAQPRVRSALVMYLEGVQRWTLAVAEALDSLAVDLLNLSVDWSRLRADLALAKAEWPTELTSELAGDVAWLGDDEISATLDELRFALHLLDENLTQRFG